MRARRTFAVITVALTIGAGSVIAPFVPAAPAQAASKVETWTSALSKTFSAAGKVFGLEKTVGFLAGTGVLSFAGPLLTFLVADSGPSIGDVLKKLDGMENQLASVQQDLDAVRAQLTQTDADVLMGTCNVETSALTTLLANVDAAQDEYSQIVQQMKSIRTKEDVQALADQTTAFVKTVLGPDKTGEVFLEGTDLGAAVIEAHERLVSTPGSQGVIEVCGKAFLEDWRARNSSQSAVSSMQSSVSGAWVDDRSYYLPVQEMLQYWQTVQAQAVFFLQQASYLQAVQEYPSSSRALSVDDAAQACANVEMGSTSATRCAATLTFTRQFHDDLVLEWEQLGAPYSSDESVLALGADVTGLQGNMSSTIWMRHPEQRSSGTPQTTSLPSGFSSDDLVGWAPANSAQWASLSAGFVASHAGSSATPAPVVQPWTATDSVAITDGDQYASQGVSPFSPVDVLSAMGTAVDSDGNPQFSQTNAVYWIPGESATRSLANYEAPNGLSFPGVEQVGGGGGGDSYYAGPGISVACMTVPTDGVLCDPDVVASWWVSRQGAKYDIHDKNLFTDNYTSTGEWTVTPSTTLLPGLYLSGGNAGCGGQELCPIVVNEAVTMAPWVVSFTDATGVVHDPAQDAASTYTQNVWPVMDVPTGQGCVTSWGVPSRCGDAMQQWLSDNIPDPSAAEPEPSSAPTVTVGSSSGSAVCNAPTWEAQTAPDGSVLTYGDALWSATDAAGNSATVVKPWGASISVANDLVNARTWPQQPVGLALSCTVQASFGSAVNTVHVISDTVSAADRDGTWQVGVEPAASVVDSPDSADLSEGATQTLSATLAYGDPADGDEKPTALSASSSAAPAISAALLDGSPAPKLPSPGSAVLAGWNSAAAAPSTAVSVRWEKRESGATEWTPADGESTLDLTEEFVGPQVLAQHRATSQISLAGLDQDDQNDSYRAVFSTPDGEEYVSAEARLTVAPFSWVIPGIITLFTLVIVATVIAVLFRRAALAKASSQTTST